MIYRLIDAIIHPEHDRRAQACAVIIFAMAMIVLAALGYVDNSIESALIGWSYSVILAVVGVYHLSRGFGDWNEAQIKSPALPLI